MHLTIARDKFSRDELTERKEASEELVRDIERYRGSECEREPNREPPKNAQGFERERDTGGARDKSQEMER